MSDAAIVGIIAIIATTVLGPVIAYQIRKDEEGRRDVIDAIDGAVDALTTARGTINWLRGIIDKPLSANLAADIRRGLDEIHVAEAYVTRLHLRLGQHPITEAFVNAESALAVLGADVYARYTRTGGPSLTDIDRAEKEVEKYSFAFIDAAKRWHEDHFGQP